MNLNKFTASVPSIPQELEHYFNSADIAQYPFLSFRQHFVDFRGGILNVADGRIGDVAIIDTVEGSTRASHVHKTDWHITYLISGEFEYSWKSEDGIIKKITVGPGQGILTLAGEAHKMEFVQDSLMIAISRNSRVQDEYESDTLRMEF